MQWPSCREQAGKPRWLAPFAIALALPPSLALFGVLRSDPPEAGSITVGGVQPGVFDDRAARLDAHIEKTHAFAGGDDVDFVVWGQTSVAYDPFLEEPVGERLEAVTNAIGADLFVNVDARSETGIVKTTVQFASDGPAPKSHGKGKEDTPYVRFGDWVVWLSLVMVAVTIVVRSVVRLSENPRS